jgi:hypothetical protein
MHFIISTILGEDWVTHADSSGGFSITSDGFVLSGSLLIGEVGDFERNVWGYVKVAELSNDEFRCFKLHYDAAVTDWRN